jgi:hypothetical protein
MTTAKTTSEAAAEDAVFADRAQGAMGTEPTAKIMQLQRTFGNQAVGQWISRQAASPEPTIQRKPEKYVRSLQSTGNFDYEVDRLKSVSALDGGSVPDAINEWLDGRAGMATTRYNEGQKRYYSPVGYVVELDDDAQVFENFAGDGNTTTLSNKKSKHHYGVYELIRTKLLADDTVKDSWIAYASSEEPLDSDMHKTPITDENYAIMLKGVIEEFLKLPSHSDDDNALVAPDDVKSKVKELMKESAQQGLQQFYSDPTSEVVKNRKLGPGLDPDGLGTMESNIRGAQDQIYRGASGSEEIKYTESAVHAKLINVVGAFYTAEQGQYPDLISDSWRTDANWLANRSSDAGALNAKFTGAGQAGAKKMKLEDGTLSDA